MYTEIAHFVKGQMAPVGGGERFIVHRATGPV